MEEIPKPVMPTVNVPVMTREQFASLSGLGEDVVRGMIEKGHLPSIKIGRHRLVNIVLLTMNSLTEVWDK